MLAGSTDADTSPAWLDTSAQLYGLPGSGQRAARVVLDVEADPADDDLDDKDPPLLPPQLGGYLDRRFPGVRQSVECRVACHYGETPDDTPLLGRLPGSSSAWIVGGDGGGGSKHAPAWSSVLVDAIEGLRYPPARFAADRLHRHQETA